MKIVKPQHTIVTPQTHQEFIDQCVIIEKAGRVCYKSEDSITASSFKPFCEMLIKRGHEAMIEFGSMVVHFITDRGVTHELVRHRLCSFAQESTRYCNYSKDKFDNECSFIRSSGIEPSGHDDQQWREACEVAEKEYFAMLECGMAPQIARSVLPNSLKTEIVVKANFREWRHIFKLRAISKAAHPDMRALMIPLYEECRQLCPTIFEMGDVE
jgi:thymidylate synthase (FAD)